MSSNFTQGIMELPFLWIEKELERELESAKERARESERANFPLCAIFIIDQAQST